MPVTGMIGTPYAQPGQIQPGYFCTGNAVWIRGDSAVITFGTPGVNIPLKPAQTLSVTSATASQIAIADPTWWAFH